MKLEYEAWKELNPNQDFSQKEYQQAIVNTRAFEYESISDSQEYKELLFQMGAIVVIGGVTLICPPAGMALGAVYGAYELSSAVSGKDLVSGRELGTSERWVRGLLAPLDIVPGVSGLTKFSSTVRLIGVSDNMGKLGLSSGVKGGIQQGATSGISNLVETASKFGADRLRRAEAAFENGAHIVKNKVIKDTIEVAQVADKGVAGLRKYLHVPQKTPAFAGASSVGKTREVIENTHTIENGVRVVLNVSDEVKIGSGVTKGTVKALGNKKVAVGEEVITQRVLKAELDLTPKITPYKSLSRGQQIKIKEKIENRTVTKEEYKRYQWDKRFTKRRAAGVNEFWKQEKKRILDGEPTTREWTNEQIQEILKGKKPQNNGHSIIGHHTYNAMNYPHICNRGELIYPVTGREHLKGWHGGSYSKNAPGRPVNLNYLEEF